MKIVHVFALIFLAVWLVLTGIVGLAGVVLSPVLAVIMNLLALASGIMILVTVGKCCCDCEKCHKDKVDFSNK